ncbi:fumarylacetoacetate hydrolase family protein [Planctomycetaceae bacterium]|nr:fumarylacetoacetate hydrolase family protein [Planctomycetaceae bacterium]MDC0273941.1 fumarylacetoacetate hydrolase family protein [Planctomycetaceae bacterium]
MKFARLKADQGIKLVGVEGSGDAVQYFDLRAADETLPESLPLLFSKDEGLSRAATAFESAKSTGKVVTGTLLAPIDRPGKVICIGLNYRDHAEETGSPIPTEPVCFNKFPQTVIGPDEAIVLPGVSQKVDYEAELVIVIGKEAKHVSAADAGDYVAGYMNGHDVSARDWQKGRPGGQWLLGKTPDTFAPTGPYLVTSDEVDNPENLPVKLWLNGDLMQDGNTSEFIFGVGALIEHLTKLITLEPGDLIFTGTPPGVGDARTPPVYLKEGDTVEIEIGNLGRLTNSVKSE